MIKKNDRGKHLIEQAKTVRLNKEFIKAIEIGDVNLIKNLIKQGVEYHKLKGSQLHQYSAEHDTALHKAVKLNHTEIVKVLLQSNKTDVNAQTRRGRSPCHYAVYPGVSLDILELLICNNGDIHLCDNDNATPLFWASYFDNIQVLQYLIKHGSDPWAQDNFASVFEWACIQGSINTVQHYLESFTIDSSQINKACDYAAENCHLNIVELLQQHHLLKCR